MAFTHPLWDGPELEVMGLPTMSLGVVPSGSSLEYPPSAFEGIESDSLHLVFYFGT